MEGNQLEKEKELTKEKDKECPIEGSFGTNHGDG